MKTIKNKAAWFVFAFLAIGVGLYPLMYLMAGGKFGVLFAKSTELLANNLWNLGFYGHITFGGIALMTGWSQFSKKLRNKRLQLHRNLGKTYVFTVLISGICAVYIGFYATGGWATSLGFILLGLVWLSTTLSAYFAIRRKDIVMHQKMMMYSYAACFAAVTLRLWLPILHHVVFGEFLAAYKVVAWLCWVPNLMVAHFLVRKNIAIKV
ncbi:DUF2306 domain-containing protein [Allomuricauda sp. d1]|uniref:DUF2306 domain-containing protein n=1 Tax=Allomuricauda sp. d1 TaxID=3136725 RepID=UPI0031D5B0CE